MLRHLYIHIYKYLKVICLAHFLPLLSLPGEISHIGFNKSQYVVYLFAEHLSIATPLFNILIKICQKLQIFNPGYLFSNCIIFVVIVKKLKNRVETRQPRQQAMEDDFVRYETTSDFARNSSKHICINRVTQTTTHTTTRYK